MRGTFVLCLHDASRRDLIASPPLYARTHGMLIDSGSALRPYYVCSLTITVTPPPSPPLTPGLVYPGPLGGAEFAFVPLCPLPHGRGPLWTKDCWLPTESPIGFKPLLGLSGVILSSMWVVRV